jgi:microcystin-dependent protein
MAVTTSLAACSTNPALNGPDGAADLPSTIDDAIRYALSFIAQLRDGSASGWQTGMISQFATGTTPMGWLKLNGQLVSRATYPSLFAFASASGLIPDADFYGLNKFGLFSAGDGATTFRIPDLRSMVLRGLDEARGLDSGRALGVFQDYLIVDHSHATVETPHSHTGSTAGGGGHGHTVNDPPHSHQILQDVTNSFGGGAGLSGVGNIGAGTYNTQSSLTGVTVNPVGDHVHAFTTNAAATGLTVGTASGSGAEQRVRNVAYPFYIKF